VIMWMSDYIKAVKRGLRDQHGFTPTGGTKDEPLFANVPDGEYPMKIDGDMDYVRCVDGKIECCRFKKSP